MEKKKEEGGGRGGGGRDENNPSSLNTLAPNFSPWVSKDDKLFHLIIETVTYFI